jgi:hypothetical protein
MWHLCRTVVEFVATNAVLIGRQIAASYAAGGPVTLYAPEVES